MSIGTIGSGPRDEASEASADDPACATAGLQIGFDGLALRRSGGSLRPIMPRQFAGFRRELVERSSLDGFAGHPEERPFAARVPPQFCVALRSRAKAPRFRRNQGTVLGVGPRQTSFWFCRAYYRRAAPQLQMRCTILLKKTAIPKTPQSQQNILFSTNN
jgi:hypothetical protein